MYLSNNIGISKSIPLFFSKSVEDIILSGIEYPNKIIIVTFLKDEDLVNVHHEELLISLVQH